MALLLAAPALAAPVNYNFDSGNIQIQAFRTDTNALVFDETLDMAATSFMVFDPAGTPGFGAGTLDDFTISTVANQGPFSLVSPFGPYDMVTVETGNISPDAGYATVASIPIGGNAYSITVGPVLIDATYGASDSGGFAPPVTGQPANIIPGSTISGTITLLAGGIQLSLTGLTMGTVDGAPFGETADLSLTANLTFFGSAGPPIPEPATGSLVALGLLGLAIRGRRQRP
ncbi:MAG: PEP-CTERM sorting domain-containing protein [Myxococcota bacterium]